MKTIVSILAGLAAGAVFAVEQPAVQVVSFSSEGGDTYADKTPILEGEGFALVWSPDGKFGGIAADGRASRAGDKVIYIGKLGTNGKCPYVEFHIANDYFTAEERQAGGKFALWVLDTRVFANGELKSFGWNDGKGVISYSAPAAEATVAASFGAGAPGGAVVGGGAAINRTSTDLASIKPPVIDGPYFVKDASGAACVQIGLPKTVLGAKYVILGADNVMMNGAQEGAVTTGTGGEMQVIAPAFGNFYQAVVK